MQWEKAKMSNKNNEWARGCREVIEQDEMREVSMKWDGRESH